ncbi:hypothetical protein HC028_10100 [Planosporangium flavigriseum]|nr:hypothetical protein [Planosporangium flavigriseum]NJC64851.1 hypothetical protein [Planosporangium flavigriseum]
MKRFGLIGCVLAIALTALLVAATCGRPARPEPELPQPPLPDTLATTGP